MKEQIIQLPDNFEVKEIKDNKIILVEKEKKLTYEDVAKKLFGVKTVYWINKFGEIDFDNNVQDAYLSQANNASTEKQLEKLLAINKLMNVAKYLNDGWQPDWNDEKENKYFITYNYAINEIQIDVALVFKNSYVYFKSKELAQQAIEIFGEETIKLALCTDY